MAQAEQTSVDVSGDGRESFTDSPQDVARRISLEVKTAEKWFKKWQKQGEKIVKRFLDLRENTEEEVRSRFDTRLNIFTANVQTQRAMLYGKVPKVDVTRRYADPNDDVARVAGEMTERILNADVEDDEDGYATAIGLALDDRLLVGLGMARARYEATFRMTEPTAAIIDPTTGEELAPEVASQEELAHEEIDFDYFYWRDVLWSPARTWGEVRWVGFRVYMSRAQVKKRFGAKVAAKIPYHAKRFDEARAPEDSRVVPSPWQRAEVWEVWSKEDEKVYWWCKGYGEILDAKDDPYKLDGFWPFPKPMVANVTSSAFLPRPDFLIAQDLYNEVDYVSTRITTLERAVKVVGVYDEGNDGIKRVMQEGCDNDLIPVPNWAMFAEKGGMNGAISWLPIKDVVEALSVLRDYRTELVRLTYEITGMSDLMRGASEQRETATAQAIKAKYGSVRLQAQQDEFARFCTDLLRVKYELIRKLFSDETIVQQSNMLATADAQFVGQALELIRSDAAQFRVAVKPENISFTDYAAIRSERSEFMQTLTGFAQALPAFAQVAGPSAMKYSWEMLKWAMAGFKGSSEIEGVLDEAIQSAEQAAQQAAMQPPQPSPQEQAAQVKLQSVQAKAAADAQTRQAQAQADVMEAQATSQVKIAENAAKTRQNVAAEAAKLHLTAQKEATTALLRATRGTPPPGV